MSITMDTHDDCGLAYDAPEKKEIFFVVSTSIL